MPIANNTYMNYDAPNEQKKTLIKKKKKKKRAEEDTRGMNR
jgi:hypothetical protein